MVEYAGVWIDQARSHVVFAGAGADGVQTIESGVQGRHKSTGHAGAPLPGHLGGGQDSRMQRHHDQELERYYRRLVKLLAGVQRLLILGPGEAPGELRKHLEESGMSPGAVTVRASDKLTEAQLAAAVREHFGHPAPRRA